jgi:hypothetical protein
MSSKKHNRVQLLFFGYKMSRACEYKDLTNAERHKICWDNKAKIDFNKIN